MGMIFPPGTNTRPRYLTACVTDFSTPLSRRTQSKAQIHFHTRSTLAMPINIAQDPFLTRSLVRPRQPIVGLAPAANLRALLTQIR